MGEHSQGKFYAPQIIPFGRFFGDLCGAIDRRGVPAYLGAIPD
jgi:hypothetical protein